MVGFVDQNGNAVAQRFQMLAPAKHLSLPLSDRKKAGKTRLAFFFMYLIIPPGERPPGKHPRKRHNLSLIHI